MHPTAHWVDRMPATEIHAIGEWDSHLSPPHSAELS